MLVEIIIMGIGILFLALGYLLWKKEKISLLHDYHYDKVSEENKKAFCTISGSGVISIGTGLFTTAVIFGITDSALSFIAFAIGGIAGYDTSKPTMIFCK